MSQNRYYYTVSLDPKPNDMDSESLLLGEGSGPASHIIANLERMIEEIKLQESAALIHELQGREDPNLPGTLAGGRQLTNPTSEVKG